MKKVILAGLTCALLFTLFVTQNANASIEKQVNDKLVGITQKINKEVQTRSELSYSSNPYDYIQENQDFDEIVALGNDALPVLHKKLADSKNDGLQEYITAIAIERISKTDLKKNESTKWESAKGFSKQWNKYLKAIPSSVEQIANNPSLQADEKNKKLVELGTPALPFVLEQVESGNEQVFAAAVALSEGGNDAIDQTKVSNKKEWAAANKSKFDNLKKYVLNQQN